MNAVWLASHYPPSHVGGSAESVRLAAVAYSGAGHSLTVVTPKWSAACPDVMTEVWGRVARVPTGLDLPAGQLAGARVFGLRLQLRMARAAVREAPRGARLVHAQDRRVLLASWLASRWLSVPLVLTLRDHGILCPLAICLHGQPSPGAVPGDCGQRKLWRTCAPDFASQYESEHGLTRRRLTSAYWYARLSLDRALAERAALVLFVSSALQKAHASAGFPRRAKATVLHSPVEPAQHGSATDHRAALGVGEATAVVLFADRPSIGKGWPLVGRTAELTLRTDAAFVHVGAMPARRHPLVRSMGFVPHEGMAAWYRTADVVLVPSIQQNPLPRSALEAAAGGCMVLGTRAGGLPEVIDDPCLFSVENFPDHAAQLLRGLTRDSMRSVGQWQQAVVLERFGPARVLAHTERIYAEVVR